MQRCQQKHTKMKRIHILSLFLLSILLTLYITNVCYAQQPVSHPRYKLAWQDDFRSSRLDTNRWSLIERGPSEWQKFMSPHKSLFRLRNGYIRLYARQNDGIDRADTASYLTGGICTQHKRTFTYGKIEVRARIHGATGCWPAIWIKSDDPKLWGYPERAEIDIMEYASHWTYVSQTMHSNYTDILKKTTNPKYQVLPQVDVSQWNVYGVEIRRDRVLLTVNDEVKLDYPKIETTDVGQFPYGVESFLLIDMQVGNKYLKEIIASEYPAWMDVDWVRVYEVAE